MVYKEEYLPYIEEWANNEWTLNLHLCHTTNLKMQTALCQEVTVPQVLLKSLAVPDPSCIWSWERTQLLFHSAGNSLCKPGCDGVMSVVHLQAWCRHSQQCDSPLHPAIQLHLPSVWLRINLQVSRQMHFPKTYLLHVLFKALRYIYVLSWFA